MWRFNAILAARPAWMRRALLLAPLLFAIFSGLPSMDVAVAAEPEPLRIVTSAGPQDFLVEVMRSDADRQRGLMFRRFLPKDRGMLFDFETEQPVMMWMKNTFIPLDMIFIGADGHIVSIAENTEPLSENTIPSGGLVKGVLEVPAGTAARATMKAGDLVRHKMFGT